MVDHMSTIYTESFTYSSCFCTILHTLLHWRYIGYVHGVHHTHTHTTLETLALRSSPCTHGPPPGRDHHQLPGQLQPGRRGRGRIAALHVHGGNVAAVLA